MSGMKGHISGVPGDHLQLAEVLALSRTGNLVTGLLEQPSGLIGLELLGPNAS